MEKTKSFPGNPYWFLAALVALALIAGVLAAYSITSLLGGDGQETADMAESQPVDVGDLQARAEEAEAALESGPNDRVLLAAAGDAYLEMGMRQSGAGGVANISESYRSYKAAADYYRRILALEPADVEVRIDLALTYFYLAMYDVAERELVTVTQADPVNQRAWLSLGWIQDTAGRYEQAKASWQQAITIDPASPAGQEAQRFLDSSMARPTTTTP